MLNDRPATVKWKIALDLGPATASAGYLLVFEVLRRTGLFADRPGSHDRLQCWTDAQMLTALVLMNVDGLDRVLDVARLEEDEGLRVIAERMEPQIAGLPRRRITERFPARPRPRLPVEPLNPRLAWTFPLVWEQEFRDA